MEKCPAPGGHVLKPTKTIFEHIQDIIGKNRMTKFHDKRKINVTLRVLTRKNAPPPIFKLVQDIIGMNLLTELHEDRTITVASRVKNAPLEINVASRVLTRPYKEKYIIGTNLLTEFHEDRKINVASRVLTRKNAPPLAAMKNAPPLDSHVIQAKVIIFKLIQDINKTNLLTKLHEDWK
ncbi:hypothetical protein DPMN_153262 [Dreissena polymorpha]|uniref:Uncharacterized protein n=1 Tax=Dreissena polymorpha TaxID=45954 RepID=A0A9D4FKG7_DREPO|nr:hypothetical protein DPMN_153262 [Dreissena polymorpha]